MLGAKQLESSSAKKDFGILGDKKLTIHQQYALTMKKANSILDCIRKTIASMSSKVILDTHLEC